jgi:hypothetical protein
MCIDMDLEEPQNRKCSNSNYSVAQVIETSKQ